MNANVLLVLHTQPLLREGIASLLGEQEGVTVTECSGDEQAVIGLTRELKPELVVLDADGRTFSDPDSVSRLMCASKYSKFVWLSLKENQMTVLTKESIESATKDDLVELLRRQPYSERRKQWTSTETR